MLSIALTTRNLEAPSLLLIVHRVIGVVHDDPISIFRTFPTSRLTEFPDIAIATTKGTGTLIPSVQLRILPRDQ